MPADITASKYRWYMTSADQIVCFEWIPAGPFQSSMSFGELLFLVRPEPDGEWTTARDVGEMPWVVAQCFARKEGFNIEVAEQS